MEQSEALAVEQTAENQEPAEAVATPPESGKKKKKLSKRKISEYIFCYGMLLLPLVQFAIFYVWINSNSIIMAFQEFDGYGENGGELFKWSFYNFQRFFREWSNPNSVIMGALVNKIGRAHV